jgi:hypothetical protein
MAVIFGLRGLGFESAAGIALIGWIALCVWSWVVPPILGRIER